MTKPELKEAIAIFNIDPNLLKDEDLARNIANLINFRLSLEIDSRIRFVVQRNIVFVLCEAIDESEVFNYQAIDMNKLKLNVIIEVICNTF